MRAAHKKVNATVCCASISIRVILVRGLIQRQSSSTSTRNRHLTQYLHSRPFSCAVVGPHGTVSYSYRNATIGSTRLARRAGI